MIENNYSQIPTSAPSSHPSKKKMFFLILGLLLLLAIGIFVFFFLKKDSLPQEINTEDTRTSSTNVGVQNQEDPFPLDKDRDGINDAQEESLGLSNLQFDTDNDGLGDADEIDVWKTDPKKFDTDNDGFGDGYEVVSGYSPLESGKVLP